MKSNYYPNATTELRRELLQAIPHDTLLELHACQPWRHYLLLLRQFLLLAVGFFLAGYFDEPYLWMPGAMLAGLTVFNFTVFLHEVVHEAVERRGSARLYRTLGVLYALPSGISRLQFQRWHLDHHQNLGSPRDDPKRHYLSPKVNKRWYKLLYCTPALIPIYFRAARREAASYPPELQARISVQRTYTILVHLAVVIALALLAGPWVMFKVYVVPFLLVFPVAFTVNRLGQHYAVDPADPAKWSTLMKASRFWDFVFCYSNYHLEHHYFPRVPFYKLRRLHFLLQPFFARRGIRARTYSWVLYNWFIKNRPPHTNWDELDQSHETEAAVA